MATYHNNTILTPKHPSMSIASHELFSKKRQLTRKKNAKEKMRGRVVSWTRPRLQQQESKSDGSGGDKGHWVSEVVLEAADGDEQKIPLQSDSAEDHLWITEAGSWIQLQPDRPMPVQQSNLSPPPPPLYVNMDEAMQVVGLVATNSSSSAVQRAPTVILEASTTVTTKKREEVLCLNAKVWSELVRMGIGSWIRLYNIKRVQLPPALVITETSGMRTLSSSPPPPPTAPSSVQGQDKMMKERKDNENNTITDTNIDTKKEVNGFHITNKHGKWECLNCGWLNFPTKTVCGRCDCNRMEHSLPANWILRKVKRSWSCRHCPFAANFFDSEWCWQCGRKRTRILISKP